MVSPGRLAQIFGEAIQEAKGKIIEPVVVTAIQNEPKDRLDARARFRRPSNGKTACVSMSPVLVRGSEDEAREILRAWVLARKREL